MAGPLANRAPLITRSRDDAASWADALAALGARPVILPCIETEPCAGSRRLATEIDGGRLEPDWIVFTSRRGVDTIADLLAGPLPSATRVAAVGDSTAARARERLGRIDCIGPGTATGLARTLAATVAERDSIVLALAENAGTALEDALAGASASVSRFDVYRTIPMPPRARRRPLSAFGCDAVVFASPSAVTGFANQVDVDIDARFVTIGPSTSAAVRERDWPVAAEAREPGLAGIIDSLETQHA